MLRNNVFQIIMSPIKKLTCTLLLLVATLHFAQATTIDWKDFERNIRSNGAWLMIDKDDSKLYISLRTISRIEHDEESNFAVLHTGSVGRPIKIDIGTMGQEIRLQRILDTIANAR